MHTCQCITDSSVEKLNAAAWGHHYCVPLHWPNLDARGPGPKKVALTLAYVDDDEYPMSSLLGYPLTFRPSNQLLLAGKPPQTSRVVSGMTGTLVVLAHIVVLARIRP